VIERRLYRRLDLPTLVHGRFVQYVVHDIVAVTRVPDADAQTIEVSTREVGHEITQTIMTAVSTALFQAHGAGREVQIVMHHQHLPERYLIEPGQRSDRLATAIHERHGLLQQALEAAERTTPDVAVESRFSAQRLATGGGQRVQEPEPGVVPGRFVTRAGIAQPDNEPQWRAQRQSSVPPSAPSSPSSASAGPRGICTDTTGTS
jgi:hypothetical protein